MPWGITAGLCLVKIWGFRNPQTIHNTAQAIHNINQKHRILTGGKLGLIASNLGIVVPVLGNIDIIRMCLAYSDQQALQEVGIKNNQQLIHLAEIPDTQLTLVITCKPANPNIHSNHVLLLRDVVLNALCRALHQTRYSRSPVLKGFEVYMTETLHPSLWPLYLPKRFVHAVYMDFQWHHDYYILVSYSIAIQICQVPPSMTRPHLYLYP